MALTARVRSATLARQLGARVQRLRRQAGLSQGQVAAALSPPCSQQCISLWEQGRRQLDMHTLIQLCTLFSCTLTDLYPREAFEKEVS